MFTHRLLYMSTKLRYIYKKKFNDTIILYLLYRLYSSYITTVRINETTLL